MTELLNSIALGTHFECTKWQTMPLDWDEFLQHIYHPREINCSYADFKALPETEQSRLKDGPGYVGGGLMTERRKQTNMVGRKMLTLDVDKTDVPFEDFVKRVKSLSLLYGPFKSVMHTTTRNSPETPKYRLIIPLSEGVITDAYTAIVRRIAGDIDIDMFDTTCFGLNQFMYFPTRFTGSPEYYKYELLEGEFMNPETIKSAYEDWTDIKSYPYAKGESIPGANAGKRKKDPRTLSGLFGAFCVKYSITETVEKFLSDIYTPSRDGKRFKHKASQSAPGLLILDGDLLVQNYSDSDTLPHNHQYNAIDLVRWHQWGHLDEGMPAGTPFTRLPSYKACQDWLGTQKDLKRIRLEMDRSEMLDAFKGAITDESTNVRESLLKAAENENNDWEADLYDDKGNPIVTIENIKTIILNRLNLGYDMFNYQKKWRTLPPWRTKLKDMEYKNLDTDGLLNFLEIEYKIYAKGKTDEALGAVCLVNMFHPVRQYFKSLPEWDGVQRMERVLIDWLGAEDNVFVKEATFKFFLAAICRVFHPGMKFDNILTLSGPEGIGKSTLAAKMAGQWFNDNLQVSMLGKKDVMEHIRGHLILELAEMAGHKKADDESIKAFASRQKFGQRDAYAEFFETHWAQHVCIATTNSENPLRDSNGNRRWWFIQLDPGRVPEKTTKDFIQWLNEPETVYQLWAEVWNFYRTKLEGLTPFEISKALLLSPEAAIIAKAWQDEAIEKDDLVDDLIAYCEQPKPEGWENLPIQNQVALCGPFKSYNPKPGEPLIDRKIISKKEVMYIVQGLDLGREYKGYQGKRAGTAMTKIPGWVYFKNTRRFGGEKVRGFIVKNEYILDKKNQIFGF